MGSNRRTVAAAAAAILASLSLYPIFYGFAWFWAGVAAVLVVALAGTLTRLRRLPVAVCLAGGLAALLLDLNVGFESDHSLYRVLPTPTSLRMLWDLVGLGFQESAKYAPPVPELPPMLFLATAGIGLTALLTDLIAVRLERAALAGLPMLLLFTEPFTLSISRSGLGMVITFCVGTAGYLALLSSESRDRIREWERPDPRPEELPDTRALATTGRRVGIASVAVALCVPLFIPGLHTTRLFGGQPGIGGNGSGPGGGVGFPDPNTQLSNELHESRPAVVFDYRSSDAAPQYFQIYVLDKLTSSGWQLSQPRSLATVNPLLPKPPGLTETEWASQQTTNVTLSPAVGQDELSALPAPYPAVAVRGPGQLRADRSTLMIFDAGVQLAGLRYTVNSIEQQPTPQALDHAGAPPHDIASSYTQVPSQYQGALRQIAESVVTTAKATTALQKAVALQDWLSGAGFTYTLNAKSITDAHGLLTFLTATKRGYCQQFSFAMAVLARLLGIPARVAYGFTAGTLETGGVWQVTTHDAHAWPELYFQGFGWLRFEPTPVGGAGQGSATTPTYTEQLSSGFSVLPPSFTAGSGSSVSATSPAGDSAALRHQLNIALGADSNAGSVPPHRAGLSGWEVFGLVILGLLALVALAMTAPACARLLVRRRRWRAGARGGDAAMAHAAWCELRDDLVDYRAGYSPSESPRGLAARVSDSLRLAEPAAATLGRVCLAEERARYARRPDGGAGLREDSAAIRHAIAAVSPRRRRWLARLFPSSVISPVMIRVAAITDFSGGLNTDWFARTRIGSRLGPARSSRASRASRADDDGGTATRGNEPLMTAGRRD